MIDILWALKIKELMKGIAAKTYKLCRSFATYFDFSHLIVLECSSVCMAISTVCIISVQWSMELLFGDRFVVWEWSKDISFSWVVEIWSIVSPKVQVFIRVGLYIQLVIPVCVNVVSCYSMLRGDKLSQGYKILFSPNLL